VGLQPFQQPSGLAGQFLCVHLAAFDRGQFA